MTEPQVKKTKIVSALDQLKAMTTIVADTGDFEGTLFNRSHHSIVCVFVISLLYFVAIGHGR